MADLRVPGDPAVCRTFVSSAAGPGAARMGGRSEEPDARVAHVRIRGSPGSATARGDPTLPALLRDAYFNAACLPADAGAAATLADIAARLDDGSGAPVLLLNGFDHMLPDGHVGRMADALARRNGGPVERGLLETAVERPAADLPALHGDLLGARIANLLPGVWPPPQLARRGSKQRDTAPPAALPRELDGLRHGRTRIGERTIPSGENSKREKHLDMLRMTNASPGTAVASQGLQEERRIDHGERQVR